MVAYGNVPTWERCHYITPYAAMSTYLMHFSLWWLGSLSASQMAMHSTVESLAPLNSCWLLPQPNSQASSRP